LIKKGRKINYTIIPENEKTAPNKGERGHRQKKREKDYVNLLPKRMRLADRRSRLRNQKHQEILSSTIEKKGKGEPRKEWGRGNFPCRRIWGRIGNEDGTRELVFPLSFVKSGWLCKTQVEMEKGVHEKGKKRRLSGKRVGRAMLGGME